MFDLLFGLAVGGFLGFCIGASAENRRVRESLGLSLHDPRTAEREIQRLMRASRGDSDR